MKVTCRAIALVVALGSFGIPGVSSASVEYGCFDCGGRLAQYCAPAREGGGWRCVLDEVAPGLVVCRVEGGACLNPDYGGGSGGAGGSGGGGCGSDGFCPASCFSCGGGGIRI